MKQSKSFLGELAEFFEQQQPDPVVLSAESIKTAAKACGFEVNSSDDHSVGVASAGGERSNSLTVSLTPAWKTPTREIVDENVFIFRLLLENSSRHAGGPVPVDEMRRAMKAQLNITDIRLNLPETVIEIKLTSYVCIESLSTTSRGHSCSSKGIYYCFASEVDQLSAEWLAMLRSKFDALISA